MKSLLVMIAAFFCAVSVAQPERWLESRYAPGAFLPHRISLPQLRSGPVSSFQISYTTQVNGSQDWHHYFKGPRKGIGLFALDTGNQEEMGTFYGLYPFVELPMMAGDRNELFLHMGVGLAYLTEKYDFEDNFFNKAIGSNLNYSIVMALRYQYLLDRWKIGAGISMTHASNAAIQLPNLGVNFASLDLTLAYQLESATPLVWDSEREWTKNERFDLMVGFGFRESNTYSREKHGVQELRLTYEKRFSPRVSYRIGTDAIHNGASYQELDEGRVEEFSAKALQWGIHGGIALLFGNSSLYFQNGFYLLQGHQEQGFIYHRFGGNWRLSEKMVLDLSLKTHFAKADYLALGLGYSLVSKKTIKDE